MTDRNVQYPNRFHVKPVPGTDDIYEIIPAPGAVYEDGTFWNKANVLQDATAALFGKDSTAVPDEIFAAIRSLIQTVDGKIKIATGSYVGTGADLTLTFGFRAKAVLIAGEYYGIGSYNFKGYMASFGLAVGAKTISGGRSPNNTPMYGSDAGITITGDGATIKSTDSNNFLCSADGDRRCTYYYIAIG